MRPRDARTFAPRLPDQFELLTRLTALRRLIVAFGLLGMAFGFCALFVVFSVAVTPTKVVVWPDNPYAKPALVKAGDVTVREIDAKRFFLAVSDLLLAWNSADVVGRFGEAALLMNSSWREKFRSSLEAPVAVPEELSAKRQLPALAFMVKAKVRNELRPPRLQDIRCEKAADQWNCRAIVETTTLPLYAPPPPPDANGSAAASADGSSDRTSDAPTQPAGSPSTKKRLLVQAGFREYPVTDVARYGLLVSYWEVRERDDGWDDLAPAQPNESNGGTALVGGQ